MSNSRLTGVLPVFLLVLTLLISAGCTTKISDRTVNRITTTAANVRHAEKNALFIDARPSAAYQREHIAGAVNIRLGELSYVSRDQRLVGRSPLIVYGENPGSATAIALAKRLLELEYEGVEYYEPGISGWRSAGLPLDRGDE